MIMLKMSYKSHGNTEEVQKQKTSSSDEPNCWIDATKVAQRMNELSLAGRSTDSGQATFEEASGQASFDEANGGIEHDEQTSVKSVRPDEELNACPLLSHEFACLADFVIDRRQPPPNTVSGIQPSDLFQRTPILDNSAQAGAWHIINVPNIHQNNTQLTTPSLSTNIITSAAQGSSHRTSNSTAACGGHQALQTATLELNIPPSLPEPRINNTDIPTALAERQLSFRTTSTVTPDLSPIHASVEAQHQQRRLYQQQRLPDGFYHSSCTNLPSSFQRSPFRGCLSTEDNSMNISISPHLGHPPMTAQPMNSVGGLSSSFSNFSGDPGGAAGNGRQLSHSSSSSSMKSFINDSCLVKKLYWKILNHVALTLQCRYSSASWKDLVERYGWDYERTYLFENREHREGIFFSLLREPEFQDYSLEQLRQDLFELPRRDILNDLNKMILEHNASASGGPTSQNQF